MHSFAARSHELELMDDPNIAAEEMFRTLGELETINRALAGHAPSLDGIRRILPLGAKEVSVLDVGTGGGDFPRRLYRWGERRGIRFRITAIDLCANAIDYARRHTEIDDVSFETADLFSLDPAEPFDVVHAALLLHHQNGEQAGAALRKMLDLSRHGVVVNDLHRHAFAYHAIRLLTRLFSRSRLIRNDAPLSVLRSFSRKELSAICAASGLPAPEIRWRWAFRWQMVIRK